MTSKSKGGETRELVLKSVSSKGTAWRRDFEEALFALHQSVDSYAAPLRMEQSPSESLCSADTYEPMLQLPPLLSAECTILVHGDSVCAYELSRAPRLGLDQIRFKPY